MTSILSFIFITERLENIEKNEIDKTQSILSRLSTELKFSLNSGNFKHLQKISKKIFIDDDIYAIYIQDKVNKTIVQLTKDISENKDDIFTHNKAVYSHNTQLNKNSGENNSTSSKYLLGNIKLSLAHTNTQIKKNEIISQGLLLVLFLISLMGYIAIKLANGITTPIVKLSNAVKSIKNGLFTNDFKISGTGEIAILEKGLKEMTTSLIEARKRDEENANHNLFIEKSKAQITLESIGEGVITINAFGYITYMNPAAEKLLKCKLTDTEGKLLSKFFRVKHSSTSNEFTYPYSKLLKQGEEISHNSPLVLVRKDTTEVLISETANPIYDRTGDIVGGVLVFKNFSTIQRMSDKIIYQAAHDQLTGLLNRHEFESQIRNILNISSAETIHSLCFIEIDNIEKINNSCGHIAGDKMLIEISKIIKNNIRKNDLIMRTSVGEYAIFFNDCLNNKALTLSHAIKKSINNYDFIWENQEFNISASIGLVSLNTEEINLKDIINHANDASNNAKNNGGNSVVNYSDLTPVNTITDEEQLQQDINISVDYDNFIVLAEKIQPLKKTEGNEIYDLSLGIIKNNKTIPLNELYTLTDKVYSAQETDKNLILKTLDILNSDNHSLDNISFNINLSAQTLTDDKMMEYIVKLLDDERITPHNINFELTESALISNHEYTSNFIQKLKKIGFEFSLINFGSGLCSFSFLKHIPVTKLKISSELVRNIIDEPVNISIIHSINHVCHTLSIKTIATGVDTKLLYDVMNTTDIDFLQGKVIQDVYPLNDILLTRKKTDKA